MQTVSLLGTSCVMQACERFQRCCRGSFEGLSKGGAKLKRPLYRARYIKPRLPVDVTVHHRGRSELSLWYDNMGRRDGDSGDVVIDG